MPPSSFGFSLQVLRASFSKGMMIADLGVKEVGQCHQWQACLALFLNADEGGPGGWAGQPSGLGPLLEGKQTFSSGVRVSKGLTLQRTALLVFPA